jgi:streptogramin lyase
VRIDPATNRVTASVPIAGSPFELAAGEGSVWVTGNSAEGGDVLHRIDSHTNRVVATVAFPRDSTGAIAVGEGAVWLVRSGSLLRIDPERNEVAHAIPLETAARRHYFDKLAVGHGVVWVLALEGLDHPGDVIRIDPDTNDVVGRIPAEALSMGVGPGGVWMTGCVDCDEHRDTFFAQQIDTVANAPGGPRLAVEQVGFGPLFVGEDSAWFGGYGRESDVVAFRLDPRTNTIDEFLRIGDFVFSGMAFDPENAAIWIARAAPASVVRVQLDSGVD